MSGFSEEAFNLGRLWDSPVSEAEAADLNALHLGLLIDGSLEELDDCDRLLDEALAELDAKSRPASFGPSESASALLYRRRGLPELDRGES